MKSTTPEAESGRSVFAGDAIPVSRRKTSATAEAGCKKRHSYKPLPTQFRRRRDRLNYQQIYREGDFAIYQQTWKGDQHSAAFEVIRIRRREGFVIGGRFVEPAEIYPNSEAWGVDGWTVLNKEVAFRKLRAIAASSNALVSFEQKEASPH